MVPCFDQVTMTFLWNQCRETDFALKATWFGFHCERHSQMWLQALGWWAECAQPLEKSWNLCL